MLVLSLHSQRSFLSSWKYVVAYDENGMGRIMVCWDPSCVQIDVVDVALQWIHVHARFREYGVSCYITFVSGFNDVSPHRPLWSFLRSSSE